MTIGQRISIFCGVSVILVAATGGNSLLRLHFLNETVQALAGKSLPAIHSIGKISGIAKDIRGNIRGHITADSSEDKAKAERDLLKIEQDLRTEIQDYQKSVSSDEQRALFAQVPEGLQNEIRTAARIQSLSRGGKRAEAMELFRSGTMPAFLEVQKAIDRVVAFDRQQGNRNAAMAEASSYGGKIWTLALLIFSVLCCGAIGWYTVHGVSVVLRRSLNELTSASSRTGATARTLSSSAQSLAQGASQQAAAIDETSASTEQIRAMIMNSAERSRHAANGMAEAAQSVDEANRTLGQMLVSMDAINASSARISKIIQVIDEIAFQTNILALNAAVEAARAGEAGAGFAVVADEVRNLAQRSAQAARDTAGLIEESIVGTNAGKTRLDQVALFVKSIVNSVTKVKGLVDEIGSSSEEQNRGIQEMARAISQIGQVTQAAAASAQENAAVGDELGAQSETLRQVIGHVGALIGGVGQRSARPT